MKLRHWLALTTLFVGSYTQAAVTITIIESGGNVVATATGSLNTSGLSGAIVSVPSLIQYSSATDYSYLIGQGGGNSATVYAPTFGQSGPFNFASINELADSSSGGLVGVDRQGGGVLLYVPNGYVSNGPINATSTWTATTLAGLNLTPGNYVFDYGTDRITYNVGGVVVPPVEAASVPTMPAWLQGLMAAGLLFLAAGAFRRKLRL